MPRRYDIERILIIGAGPIVIGQACEFDYSGSQGCKALKEEGYKVILINSNPATIMTDPDFADATYIEPITPEVVESIIIKERVDAILPTLGGQTALNCVSVLYEKGILEKHRVKLLGANYESIKKAEDRDVFRCTMNKIGLAVPESGIAYSVEEAKKVALEIGFPLIIRASYTLGGTGGSVANNMEELVEQVTSGLRQSRINQVLVEESLLGWKEFELEIMRDRKDNVVIICSIENFDPMGIHTGDSITIAPAQTLTDVEYQKMRNMAKAIIREIGVDTGGSNVQFAVNPKTGKIVVIEINPRVSRSSALASKATGFPIAKIAAKLSVGYSLDELPNDITKKTPASFEPTIDYCVVKIPRFTFEKFPGADPTLGVSMKSIGEAMSIGRTFKEALHKGIHSLEQDIDFGKKICNDRDKIIRKLTIPNSERLFYIYEALKQGFSLREIFDFSNIDPWFLDNILQLVEFEQEFKDTDSTLRRAKELGFSDCRLSKFLNISEKEFREYRKSKNIVPVYKSVDTCAAEFEAYTPYYYSSYESYDEVDVIDEKKVVILGSGPNRIGQGIEFDYCCCHASFALREIGIKSIMVNCNPETVSTDYDTSDRLYFEPLTYEHVMNILEKEKPLGVILQFGGQTPLKLARALHEEGITILGTSYDSIDIAEDRKRFFEFISKLDLQQPKSGSSYSVEEAIGIAQDLGYPILVRPSYVLGGRAMKIVHSEDELTQFMEKVSEEGLQYPILVDKFLEDAIEVDVDAICDGDECVIAGVMEHIEKAGVHSGDSSCSLPPFSLSEEIVADISEITKKIAINLKVIGLINIQFAVLGRNIYVLEVNPRGSRTAPFVSKATGIPWAKLAAKLCLGYKVKDLDIAEKIFPEHFSVKEVVFPFSKIIGGDVDIGVEMHSTGETMGVGKTFLEAYTKSQIATGASFGKKKDIYVEIVDRDKRGSVFILKELKRQGHEIYADPCTHYMLKNMNVLTHCINIEEVIQGLKDNFFDCLVITVPFDKDVKRKKIRRQAILHNIALLTTLEELQLFASISEYFVCSEMNCYSLQSL